MVVDLPNQSLLILDTLPTLRSKLRFLLTLGSLPNTRVLLVTPGHPLVTPSGPWVLYLPPLIPGAWFHIIGGNFFSKGCRIQADAMVSTHPGGVPRRGEATVGPQLGFTSYFFRLKYF